MALASWTDQQIIDQLNSGYKWSGSTITYTFATSSAGIYGSTEGTGFTALNSAQQDAARLALALWDDLITPDMQQVAAGSSYTSANIEFGQSTQGVSYAHAYYPSVGSVWFNSTYGSSTGSNNLVTPVIGQHGFSTFVHEIGHSLGLDHMGDYNGSDTSGPSSFQDSTVYSIMSYYGPSWGPGSSNGEGLVAWADWVGADGKLYSPQTPMINDIMAIQAVYGVETTTRTGNTVYGFNSNITGTVQSIFDFTLNKNPILAIFDSAGIDTLDLSGWNTSSIINLAPGSFSSANSMTNNISIAYTANIENAIGGGGNDTIYGNALANMLAGGGGADKLYGLDGDDILKGGAGNDTMDGGTGIDYVIFDVAWSELSFSYNAATLALTFTGLANGTDTVTNVEYFTDAFNVTRPFSWFTGITYETASISTAQASVAEGNSGTTSYTFVVTLSEAATDAATVDWTLSFGNGTGNASLSDFSGPTSGTLTFTPGSTVATIEIAVAGDTVFEGNEAFSVVLSNPSSGLYLGTASASGLIVDDDAKVINGTSAANTLTGSDLSDTINGLGGNDTLYGNAGDDTLNGGTGSDKMYGGTGDDTYVVDSTMDRVYEYAGGGNDTVKTSLRTFTLGSEVENLEYTGSSTFTGKGNSLDNTIKGGAGADVLNGLLGSDTLWGGAGKDAFLFTTALGASNIDRIADFNVADDTIRLENSIFKAFGSKTGTLAATAFTIGTEATDSADRIIYDPNTGALYYDPDGTGSAAQVQFAVLESPVGTLTNADFVLI
mgnify:CR=1 FL=1